MRSIQSLHPPRRPGRSTPTVTGLACLLFACQSFIFGQAAPAPRFTLSLGVENRDANDKARIEIHHLWLLKQKPGGGLAVWHQTSSDPPSEAYEAFEGTGQAVAFVAFGRGVYIAYDDRSVQWVRHVEMLPPELPTFSATQLPPLPLQGRILAFAAGAMGPKTLIESPDNEHGAELLSLTGTRWVPVAMPAEVRAQDVLGMAVAQTETEELLLYCKAPKGKGVVVHRLRDSQWTAQLFEGHVGDDAVTLLVSQKDSVSHLLLQNASEDGAAARPTLFLLRDGGVSPFKAFTETDPLATRSAAAVNGRVPLLWLDEQQQPFLATMDFPSGTLSPASPLALKERPVRIPPVTFMIVGAIVVGMIFFLLTGRRDPASSKPNLPKGVELAAFNRVAAACVDMAPAVAASMVIFGIYNPIEVFTRWLQQPDAWWDIAPPLLAVALHAAHTTLTEMLTASSLGKWICGCRVVDMQGRPPNAWQILARNFFKVIELLPPGVLLFLPLISPHFQRLGDLLARTVVISTLKPEKDEKPDDEEWPSGPRDGSN